ncbi:DNA repair protein RecN [Roseinatronobacter bogoriensis]|uniref:DNA repair protein RecN n=1 Tax=Roseinatronobacter bogoriensis subsp. barguzinensis TaxID=441209 RepID=A0A2K8K919_9RHOB|nr:MULTISPECIES: DNA repair protein RecN [Rhodobaca]ATX65947.1 DNA repair protein RecN [Rhodobaca barguzinensis]MBB4208072.1 DNA repair protein RecN (Recombination protein N) [Rhodobaca bogoriensis DSM 18756]TDW38712.1 DNA replication and repair protein RecN [Rhodobaca barguzinensis]TDY69250.1 DNA replication and repair protein RecN [Rhodobaca bogoriensis DSM 18756]
MLLSLDIRDVLIIDRLELRFQPGLNVLTGETGAGKSILLDSLGFVLGWRGRADLVRQGADQGEVIAEFDLFPDHRAQDILAEAGLPRADTLLLRRVNSRDGRKTAWINDRRASGEVLRALSDTLVELHGQQDDKGLLNPREHRNLLDAFGTSEAALADCRAAWRALRNATKAHTEETARLQELAAEEGFLRHAVTELEALAPEPGEEATLDTTRRRMQAAERLRADVARANTALSEEGVERLLVDSIRWLEGASDGLDGQAHAPLEALARALDALGDAQQGVENCLEALNIYPGELEAVEERLFALRGLARKHSCLPDDLATLTETLSARLARLDNSAREIEEMARNMAQAQKAYDAAAEILSQERNQAASKLDAAMKQELAPLRMERAEFRTAIISGDPGPDGRDQVSFEVATNPGAPAGPLSRIASGGELSRFLLALKVCLTRGTTGMTMIFDEIDRGVGGATADAVGRRLLALSGGAQVLVVTHSPQVAALGQHHWRVEKQVTDDMTLSRVVPLSADDRIEEIARMLSGDTITDVARAAAKELLGAG